MDCEVLFKKNDPEIRKIYSKGPYNAIEHFIINFALHCPRWDNRGTENNMLIKCNHSNNEIWNPDNLSGIKLTRDNKKSKIILMQKEIPDKKTVYGSHYGLLMDTILFCVNNFS